jgi:peptidoglycan hydrolase CwlO-like protein
MNLPKHKAKAEKDELERKVKAEEDELERKVKAEEDELERLKWAKKANDYLRATEKTRRKAISDLANKDKKCQSKHCNNFGRRRRQFAFSCECDGYNFIFVCEKHYFKVPEYGCGACD